MEELNHLTVPCSMDKTSNKNEKLVYCELSDSLTATCETFHSTRNTTKNTKETQKNPVHVNYTDQYKIYFTISQEIYRFFSRS